MVDGGEGDKIVGGVGADDEMLGGLQPDGGPEIPEREGDGAAEVDIARIPEEPYPRVRPALDRDSHLRRRRLGPLLPGCFRLFDIIRMRMGIAIRIR